MYPPESLHRQVWCTGTGLPSNIPSLLAPVAVSMVAMVVARQLKWLYNQLKVLTVSWIPYIPINLSPDRPWSKARSNDSNWWCLILFFFPFFSPLKLAFLHGFEVAVQGKKPSSFPDLVFFSTLQFGRRSTKIYEVFHSLLIF